MKFSVSFPLTVYYDASCPLCASEMHALKAADINGRLMLVDCSSADFDDRPFADSGITRESMLRLIHARDAKGCWLKGVDVFEAAYGAAGFTMLAWLWGHPRLRPCLEKFYPWIARNRQLLSRLGLTQLCRLLERTAKRRAAAAGTPGCSMGACLPDNKLKSIDR